MKLRIPLVVYSADEVKKNEEITLIGTKTKDDSRYCFDKAVAYTPFINSHDHLVGNWYPRAGDNRPYVNTHIWVEDMKNAGSYAERDKVWVNDGSFKLLKGNAALLVTLGVYKNLFSGVGVVQDHAPRQEDEYYNKFPINILKDYRQCHSLTLGNWWGDKTPLEEFTETKGKMPFIIHLGEGLDENTRNEFSLLEEIGLLQNNTLLIHGISLSEEEIIKCGNIGTSICWCPSSNYFLLGQSLNAEICIKHGVNVVLGTDSTLSGDKNLFAEIREARLHSPLLPLKEIYKMVSVNAAKALFLPAEEGILQPQTDKILILKQKDRDPFENLLYSDTEDIILFTYKGVPLLGNLELLEQFNVNLDDYFTFKVNGEEKFVLGHPQKVNETIDSILGYHKILPYLPY